MDRQLAPARPIAIHGGAPMVPGPAAAPIPRVAVGSGAIWMPPLVYVVTAPIFWLMFVEGRNRRTSLESAITITLVILGALLIGAIIWTVVLVMQRRALRQQLREGQLRVGTIAEVGVNRYPAGVYVNKSNISGFTAHIDLFVPEQGVSQRIWVTLNRTRVPMTGERVLVSASRSRCELVAFGAPYGWAFRAPFKLG